MRPRPNIRWSVTIAAAILLGPINARLANGQPPQQRAAIYVTLRTDEHPLSGRPAMVSVIRDGRIVEQREINLTTGGEFNTDSIRPAIYDVRVEGDGLVTEVKRGIHVFAGQKTDLTFDVRSGKGAHVVEYATGGLAREEVAARLSRLEAQVAELSKPKPKP